MGVNPRMCECVYLCVFVYACTFSCAYVCMYCLCMQVCMYCVCGGCARACACVCVCDCFIYHIYLAPCLHCRKMAYIPSI